MILLWARLYRNLPTLLKRTRLWSQNDPTPIESRLSNFSEVFEGNIPLSKRHQTKSVKVLNKIQMIITSQLQMCYLLNDFSFIIPLKSKFYLCWKAAMLPVFSSASQFIHYSLHSLLLTMESENRFKFPRHKINTKNRDCY